MTIFRHKATYQGYTGQACQYRRSRGLNPDSGWIDIDIEDFKEIKFFPFSFRFRSNKTTGDTSGGPLLGMLRQRRSTVATRPELVNVRGKGFNEFGDLTLATFKNGEAFDCITYRDVYVAPDGIEEVEDDLARVRAHDEGRVRVPLTDIRQFYPNHSPFLQRINVVLRSGNNDPDSTKENGVFFTLAEVLRTLFPQLPGSPNIVGGDLSTLTNVRPPRNVIGRGEPIVQVIQDLLDRYGLIASFTPDGDYTINRRVSKRGEDGKVAVAVGTFKKLDFQHYERKTQTFTQRPSIVQVIGKQRMRRVIMPYIPVFKDVDAKWRRLEDVEKLWGYTLDQVNEQAFANTEKQYDDIPPIGSDLAFFRREVAREHFYKSYAPAPLFPFTAATDIADFKDKDIETLEYLPVQDLALYTFQATNLINQLPIDTDARDLGEVVLVPPVVTATYLTSGLFTDFEEVEKRFEALKAGDIKARAELLRNQARWTRRQRNINKDSIRYEKALNRAKLWGSDTLQRFRQDWREGMGLGEGDIERIRGVYIRFIEKAKVEERGAELSLQDIGKKLSALGKKILEWEKQFGLLKKLYEKRGALWLKYNVPPRVISGGYALDRDTGILHFNNVVALATKPFYLEGDPEKVLQDGLVSMAYNYELNWNWGPDFSSFWIAAEDKDDDPKIDILSVNDIGGIPPFIIRAPDMRLYEEENGTPMNFGPMRDVALDLATPILSQPRVRTGFNQQYEGLRKVVLDGGVHQVTHTFDGDVGYTHVAINAPGARQPLGAPNVKGVVDQQDIRVRKAIATESEFVKF